MSQPMFVAQICEAMVEPHIGWWVGGQTKCCVAIVEPQIGECVGGQVEVFGQPSSRVGGTIPHPSVVLGGQCSQADGPFTPQPCVPVGPTIPAPATSSMPRSGAPQVEVFGQ